MPRLGNSTNLRVLLRTAVTGATRSAINGSVLALTAVTRTPRDPSSEWTRRLSDDLADWYAWLRQLLPLLLLPLLRLVLLLLLLLLLVPLLRLLLLRAAATCCCFLLLLLVRLHRCSLPPSLLPPPLLLLPPLALQAWLLAFGVVFWPEVHPCDPSSALRRMPAPVYCQ
jgi:hypothetical protein